ncbi:peptidoglycan-binding protein [Lentibacillus sp. CBA3610]|uniref:peptidoglycan-binding protein n=1 Tax=Lentibacillus sp. CBA3610 TaxID=2518176 RepID=UPI0015959AF5|nr:peptidoglycan-binding protein [Lentibacillus sp. CBA3610]QKY70422.1 hypothetical protein Len3610_13210 [Lentibacillus sp. CBA3610]
MVKLRNSMVLFIMMFSLFHFSSVAVGATGEVTDNSSKDGEENYQEEQNQDAMGVDDESGEGNEGSDSGKDEGDSKNEEIPVKDEEKEEENLTNESEDSSVNDSSKNLQIQTNSTDEEGPLPYHEGDEGQHIEELKEKLISLGFADWQDLTSTYDEETVSAVKEFQGEYNLDVTGIADEATRNTIDVVLEPPFRLGDRGESVTELKENLVELGFADWSGSDLSHIYDEATEGVVEEFQSANDLTVDGIAGADTLAKIDKLLTDEPEPQYEVGDSGDHIVALKEDLTSLGFANWSSPSRYYGSITAGVVEDFQEYYGLKVTGAAGEETRTKIEEVLNPPYRNGDRGNPVVELKEDLVELGFANWSNPSQYYGSVTAGIVKDFQTAYGMTEDGIAGQNTLSKINEVLSDPQYRDGDSGDHIIALKEDLTSLGFANWSSPSKYYGSITAGVVEDFQEYYGLNVTGIAGEETRVVIEEVLNPPYRSGDRGDPIVELKEKLTELGFANWSNPSQYYGGITAGVVEDFQATYGLEPDGIADENTLEEMEKVLPDPRYREGDQGDHVVELKEDLTALGFANWSSPSQYYGSITAGVVEDFQKYYGLNANGIANKDTRDKIEEVLKPPYQNGDRGNPVVELKEKLVELGFANWSNPSQFYGSVTSSVVERFQSVYGLTQDGVADEDTLEEVEKVLSSEPQYRPGGSGDHVVTLKEDLTRLGFANWSDPTLYYGSITASVVEDFQDYYNLPVTGTAYPATLSKIEEVLTPAFQNGDRGNPVVGLKENLTTLGFANWTNPSQYYGNVTAGVVEEFQDAYGLRITGKADTTTLSKLDEFLSTLYQNGDSGGHIVTLKENLTALGFANWSDPTPYYGSITAGVVEDFQATYGLHVTGVVDQDTLERINSEITKQNSEVSYTQHDMTYEEALEIQMGRFQQTDQYRNAPAYVSSEYISINDSGEAVTTAQVNIRAEKDAGSHVYATLEEGTAVNVVNEGDVWHEISYGSWRNPTANEVEYYMNPNNHDIFQHLLLSEYSGVEANNLNNVLDGAGELEGTGQSFINGSQEHSVNEIYLISHALHETGNGTSVLSNGSIQVGKLDKSTWVSFKPGQIDIARYDGEGEWSIEEDVTIDRDEVYDIETTYNMFGIGAVDVNTNTRGSVRAYQEGWFSPDKAIVGGSEYIGESYIHNEYSQNTIYKMRWNFEYPPHQYATDIGWATKQINDIKNLYSLLEDPALRFSFPAFN